jgi:hypothetical protein
VALSSSQHSHRGIIIIYYWESFSLYRVSVISEVGPQFSGEMMQLIFTKNVSLCGHGTFHSIELISFNFIV